MTAKKLFDAKFRRCLCMTGGTCKTCQTQNYGRSQLNSASVFCVEKILSRHKGDKPKHCDEIVLCDAANQNMGVYCIEHKGGNPKNFKMKHIRDQLQGGADVVCAHVHPDEEVEFAPVLVSKIGETPPMPTPGIALTVKFKGEGYPIENIEIGEELWPL